MKVLIEDGTNKYSKAITAVEKCMDENEVKIDFVGTYVIVSIHGKEFRCKSTSFPRFTEDEKLEIIE